MARRVAADNFAHFSRKIADLWRWEAGARIDEDLEFGGGREYFVGAADSGRGVLLVTMHLGNWEFGASLLARNGKRPLVLTAREPSRELTEIRAAARARRGIDTLVVGDDPFAFVEVIKRLQAGGLVAILLDRPAAATAVEVKFLGKPFKASVAAAELARASGCVVLPVYIVYEAAGYRAHACAPIEYDRSQLGDRAARKALTERILNGFEPVVRQYASQWYHFVPMWEPGAMEATNQDHS
jgi:KDO2-lipid IV(A) lauroyltransferase